MDDKREIPDSQEVPNEGQIIVVIDVQWIDENNHKRSAGSDIALVAKKAKTSSGHSSQLLVPNHFQRSSQLLLLSNQLELLVVDLFDLLSNFFLVADLLDLLSIDLRQLFGLLASPFYKMASRGFNFNIEEVLGRYDHTGEDMAIFLKDQTPEYLKEMFSNGNLLKALTDSSIFEDMPKVAGEDFTTLLANMERLPDSDSWTIKPTDSNTTNNVTLKSNIGNRKVKGAKVNSVRVIASGKITKSKGKITGYKGVSSGTMSNSSLKKKSSPPTPIASSSLLPVVEAEYLSSSRVPSGSEDSRTTTDDDDDDEEYDDNQLEESRTKDVGGAAELTPDEHTVMDDMPSDLLSKEKKQYLMKLEGQGHNLAIHSRISTYRAGLYSATAIEADSLFLSYIENNWNDIKVIEPLRTACSRYRYKADSPHISEEDLTSKLVTLDAGVIDKDDIERLVSVTRNSYRAESEKTWAEIEIVYADYCIHGLIEGAAITNRLDTTIKRGRGNPETIAKSMFYERMAQAEYMRNGGDMNALEANSDRIDASINKFRQRKSLGVKYAKFIEAFGLGMIILLPMLMQRFYQVGHDRTGFRKWHKARLDVLIELIKMKDHKSKKNMVALSGLHADHLQPFLSEPLDMDAIIDAINNSELSDPPNGVVDGKRKLPASEEFIQRLMDELPQVTTVITQNLKISRQDLQCLSVNKKLTGNVIDLALHSYGKMKQADVCVIPSTALQHWSSFSNEIRQKYLSRFFRLRRNTPLPDPNEKGQIPVVIRIWDSLGGKSSIMPYQKYLQDILMVDGGSFTFKIKNEPSMTQGNVSDCGVVAIHNMMRYFFKDEDVEMWTSEWSRDQRQLIGEEIVQLSLNAHRGKGKGKGKEIA
ncbi:hypothetical protein SBOR_5356 [Sclerotinia borealis F-4128]|uniref:Uncharacterized protein n=1 Tax=Sclerotinia borealis (strain F-4128) TaxID=1432307 RepID=W9CEL6_SCLBF|nr:hypothetical protein SBOR_5356 [Sclerotinia borealis F-4128]